MASIQGQLTAFGDKYGNPCIPLTHGARLLPPLSAEVS
jgi:hypothetical protein